MPESQQSPRSIINYSRPDPHLRQRRLDRHLVRRARARSSTSASIPTPRCRSRSSHLALETERIVINAENYGERYAVTPGKAVGPASVAGSRHRVHARAGGPGLRGDDLLRSARRGLHRHLGRRHRGPDRRAGLA